MANVKVTIGADPEMAVRNKKTGEFVSAHNLMPGSKLEPFAVTSGAIQVDGVAAEFNIDPAVSSGHFTTYIKTVIEQMSSKIGSDFELVSEPAVTFRSDYFKSLPEDVRELGCNPDFNAWTGKVNDRPDSTGCMRTFAGHIHCGWDKNLDPTDETHFDDCKIIARNLDYYLGLYSLQWDSDTQRRKLYGKAGSFRPKPYGIEYRPLSNVWLRTTELQQWVYVAALKCINDVINKGLRVDESYGDIARDFIDSSESWWDPEDVKKSKEHKKLFRLHDMTGLQTPPRLPKPKLPGEEPKIVEKPKAKFVYSPDIKTTIYKGIF